MKSKTMKATLAFLTASAAVVGFTGPTSAASVEGQTYSYPIATNGGSDTDITGNANATVNGSNVDVVAFADNIDADVEGVFMHFHTGATCDASGSPVIPTDGSFTAEVVDNRFVVEKSIPLNSADMDNVYFNIHDANGGAVLGCGELDFELGGDPQITNPVNRSAFDIQSQSLNGSDVLTTGSATVTGNRLSINIGLLGTDLLDSQNMMVTLQGNSTCTDGGFAARTADMLYALTSSGTTAPQSASVTFQDIFNRSAYQDGVGDDDAIDIGVEIFLTPAQAASVDDYAIVVHGMESKNSPAEMAGANAGFGGLSEQVGTVSNCSQLTVDAVNTGTINGNFYNLTFSEQNASGISGVGFLQNTTTSAVGSLGVVASLDVGNTDAYKTILGAETTCADTLTELTGTNPELLTFDDGKLGGDAGKIRGFVDNQAVFGGATATTVNDGDFVVYLTAATGTTPVACAQLSPARIYAAPPATPDPPVVDTFDGTVAQATTLAEIQAASDYRANAANKGKDQEIMRLYRAFFNREPDVAGVQYWIAVSKGEAGPEANRRVYGTLELSGFFTVSNEFKTTFESVSSGDFVDTVYNNVLGRDGEPDGVAYWTDILNGTNTSGKNAELKKGSRAEVVYYVAINDEFVNRKPYSPPAA